MVLHNKIAYITNIVGKRGKEQAVFPELPEHRAELPQVFPQERVRLPFRHGACRIPFPRQKFMPVPYIRVMLFRVSASPQSYDKLLINLIMTSNMLCKVQDL